LIAWKQAHQLALAVFHRLRDVPGEHRWLRSQLGRAAVSVPANIAEGYSRNSIREYIHFLSIARGSLAETEYFLLFLRDAGLIKAQAYTELDSLRVAAGRSLFALLRSLQQKNNLAGRGPTRVGEERADYLEPGNGDRAGDLEFDP
jgi:four helix bundle protein